MFCCQGWLFVTLVSHNLISILMNVNECQCMTWDTYKFVSLFVGVSKTVLLCPCLLAVIVKS